MRGKGKRGRHLARYVSIFLLSGGYTLPSLLPVYAAPVTGQSVTVDASHPAVTSSDPTNTPAGEPTHLAVAAGDAAAGNVGDVTGNRLTIQATSASTMSGILNVYAGRTLGAGNANGNTLTIDGRYSFPALIPNAAHPTWPGYKPLLYAGYTQNGNADGNTVIIRNVVDTGANQPNPYAYTGLTAGRSTPVIRRAAVRRTGTALCCTMHRRSATSIYTAATILRIGAATMCCRSHRKIIVSRASTALRRWSSSSTTT